MPSKKNKSLPVSDKITTQITDKHIRLKGTKISIVIPEDYQFDEGQAKYKNNDEASFEVIENRFVSFRKAKWGAGLFFSGRKFKLNQYDGVISVNPAETTDRSMLTFIFGNKSFYVSITAEYNNNNEKTEQELLNMVQSVFYNDTYQFDPLDSTNFSFDESVTGFKFIEKESNFLVYYEEGKNANDIHAANYHIGSLPLMTHQLACDYFMILLEGYTQIGIYLKDKKMEIISTVIGDYTVTLLEEPIAKYEKEGGLYMALLMGEDSCVFLSGCAFEHVDSYLDKFQDTVKSIAIKNMDSLNK